MLDYSLCQLNDRRVSLASLDAIEHGCGRKISEELTIASLVGTLQKSQVDSKNVDFTDFDRPDLMEFASQSVMG